MPRLRDARPSPDRPPFWAEVSIFDARLSPSAKFVSLAVLAAVSGCSGQVRIPVARLAQMTGLPTREVSVAVQELVDAGHLRESRRAAGEDDPVAAGGGTAGGGEAEA